MAGAILANLGAEVIHVESAGNLDSWRHHGQVVTPRRYPDNEPGTRPYNRVSLFNSQNIDKLSLSLDLKSDDGRQTFLDLVRVCDGLLANFTPGMLARLGVPPELLWSVRPDLVVLEMPGFGNSGPMKAWTALGPTMEQVAGMTAMVGYGDGRPVATGPAYLDPIGGFHGAAAMLTALLHRQRTGEGQHVELPQVEAAMHFIGEHLMRAAESGEDPHVDANRLADAAPHDVFPARGRDEWLVIDVSDETKWRALCDVVAPDMRHDPRFGTARSRVEHQAALKQRITAWSAARDKHEAAGQLQKAGVPAAAVFKANDALTSDYLNFRHFSTLLRHPEAGEHLHQGLPFRFEKTSTTPRRAAPCLGEHNHYILREMLGRSPEAIQRLEDAGVIRSVPDA